SKFERNKPHLNVGTEPPSKNRYEHVHVRLFQAIVQAILEHLGVELHRLFKVGRGLLCFLLVLMSLPAGAAGYDNALKGVKNYDAVYEVSQGDPKDLRNRKRCNRV
ncbi:hypothetical protein MDHKLMBL_20725, partial [Marinobacter flavimaris]